MIMKMKMNLIQFICNFYNKLFILFLLNLIMLKCIKCKSTLIESGCLALDPISYYIFQCQRCGHGWEGDYSEQMEIEWVDEYLYFCDLCGKYFKDEVPVLVVIPGSPPKGYCNKCRHDMRRNEYTGNILNAYTPEKIKISDHNIIL